VYVPAPTICLKTMQYGAEAIDNAGLVFHQPTPMRLSGLSRSSHTNNPETARNCQEKSRWDDRKCSFFLYAISIPFLTEDGIALQCPPSSRYLADSLTFYAFQIRSDSESVSASVYLYYKLRLSPRPFSLSSCLRNTCRSELVSSRDVSNWIEKNEIGFQA
jgi:hypothetical protein